MVTSEDHFDESFLIFVINPLSDGIQIHAVLMGGGIQCLPLKTLENEATESCEGSKWGFLRVPSTTRPLPGG